MSRELAQELYRVKAATHIRAYGIKVLVIKQGKYGVLMFSEGSAGIEEVASRGKRSRDSLILTCLTKIQL